MLSDDTIRDLARSAVEARDMAYAPYSGFAVGAALLCGSGAVYKGCNIENAAYSPSNCAERTAFFKAVSEGERDFLAIAVAGGKKGEAADEFCPPCGVCRQVMLEFCDHDSFIVILAKSSGEYKAVSLADIAPYPFKL